MEVEENLFELFSRFPTQKHVIEICRPGQGKKTCRYLSMSSRLECLRTNNSKKVVIDRRVENNEMDARGDNCEGLIGWIVKEQEKLRGRKAKYARFYFIMESKLKKIEILEDNILKVLKLSMYWKNKKGREEGREFEFDINNLDIEVNRESIILFQNLNLGESFKKQFIIFF